MMVRQLPAHLARLERTGLKCSSDCACQTPGPRQEHQPPGGLGTEPHTGSQQDMANLCHL